MTRLAIYALALAAFTACGDSTTETDGADTGDIDTGDTDTGDTDTEIDSSSAVVLTALVAKNAEGDLDENGDNDDWIEITNRGDSAADLSGWGLTDGYPEETAWLFPENTLLAPTDTIRVWCDEDPDDGPLHADFKLSGDGETVTLLNASDEIVDEVTFPILADDEVYERDDADGWSVAE
ncbi:MAG: hypothetical protein ACJARS_004817 [bacterium]